MALNRRTAVIGSAIFAPADGNRQSLEELLYDVAQAAMKDAGLDSSGIDGIVVASNDQFDGRAISVMAASGSVGGVERDILSTPSASEHAFVMGVLRVATGQYETHLVVSWSTLEASSLSEAQRLGADPYFHRALPLDELSAAGLQAAALAKSVPVASKVVDDIAARNRRNGQVANPDLKLGPTTKEAIAASRPLRWPIREGMVSPPVTGAVALVLASEDYVRAKEIGAVAWVNGMGWATEPAFLGDRDLSKAPALEAAAQRAYEEAGVDAPRTQLDLVELCGVTPYQELLVSDVLGVSGPDNWIADFASGDVADGQISINPSGGVTSLNPIFCTGLIRIAEAANQVRGRAGPHQRAGVRTALAHAASGFAMMYQTVLVFGTEGA